MIQRASVLFLLMAAASAIAAPQIQQSAQDQVLEITREWLQSISTGNRTSLNRIMDVRCVVTTPNGDILDKSRLVPNDESSSVQTLPPMDLSGPIVRVYEDTAVLMAQLRAADGNAVMNGTFVYRKDGNTWKLVALHASRR